MEKISAKQKLRDMIVASSEKRALYREQGWWGDETLSDLFFSNPFKHPDRLPLGGHADLVEACAFAIPDEILGERVGLAAVPKPDTNLDLQTTTDYLRAANVAVFKLSERLILVDRLPRSALNKAN